VIGGPVRLLEHISCNLLFSLNHNKNVPDVHDNLERAELTSQCVYTDGSSYTRHPERRESSTEEAVRQHKDDESCVTRVVVERSPKSKHTHSAHAGTHCDNTEGSTSIC
jgi:hypothetical protein